MAQCLVIDGGTGAVTASAADPCTTVLALSPAEFAALNASPLNLSPEDGLALTLAILGVWGVGFAGRMVIRALNGAD